jgi:hypothetical protein
MGRRIFHILIALILLACAVSPFVETALDCHDNMFSTGYDGESTLIIVVLLLELVLSLASLLIFLCPDVKVMERLVTKHPYLTCNSGFGVISTGLLPPFPLRI